MKDYKLGNEEREILQEAFSFLKKTVKQADDLQNMIVHDMETMTEDDVYDLYDNAVEAYVLVQTLLDKFDK